MLHEFPGRVGVTGSRRINQRLLAPLIGAYAWQPWSVGLIDATDLPAACVGLKKPPSNSPPRTLKTSQSRRFVGYKKHTLRLWLPDYPVGVQLVPIISWVTPANVSESGLLVLSLHDCQQRREWCSPLVVANMGYWGAAAKQRCREQWGCERPDQAPE